MTDTKKIARLTVGAASLSVAFTTNAMADYEDEMTCDFSSVPEFFANASNKDQAGNDKPVRLSIRVMRALLWAGLSGGGNPVSMKEAGDIIEQVGFEIVMPVLGEAVALAFGVEPDAKMGKPNGTAKEPEKTPNKTPT